MIFTAKKYKIAMTTALVFALMLSVVPALLLYFYLVLFLEMEGLIPLLNALALFVASFVISYLYFTRKYRKRKKIVSQPFKREWEAALNSKVTYFTVLNNEDKKRFRQEVQIFIGEKNIMGIETEVSEECKVLVAASAIIPTFSYPDWEYDQLYDILVYPSNFDQNYNFNGPGGNTLGLVTNGGSTMVLSKNALYDGFKLDRDKLNVGIHEFIHKIDGADGCIDGIPALLLNRKNVKEWLDVVKSESQKMREHDSDINLYGLTNQAEFFAVVSEYFFENPAAMFQKHPGLYRILSKIFKQDTGSLFQSAVRSILPGKKKKLGRNDPCPCGSGKKFKKCCLDKMR